MKSCAFFRAKTNLRNLFSLADLQLIDDIALKNSTEEKHLILKESQETLVVIFRSSQYLPNFPRLSDHSLGAIELSLCGTCNGK